MSQSSRKGELIGEIFLLLLAVGIGVLALYRFFDKTDSLSPFFVEKSERPYTLEECTIISSRIKDINYNVVNKECLDEDTIIRVGSVYDQIIEIVKRDKSFEQKVLS